MKLILPYYSIIFLWILIIYNLITLCGIMSPIYFYINYRTTGYYQFPTCFEFFNCDVKLRYYNPLMATDCLLCNYSNVGFSDSTKRDVIITYAAKKVMNIALLQRTLRTTKTNSSLVIMLDMEALNSIDFITFQFFKNCSTQIVITPDIPFKSTGNSCKHFFIPLMYLFLKINRYLIDRVIFVDLYDTLFQGDPFNEFIRKNEIHLVRELVTNNQHCGKLKWPQCYFPDFQWNDPNEYQYNSGYFGAFIDEMLCFLKVLCQYTKYNKCHDQALVNIIYNWNLLHPFKIKFSNIFIDERVLMVYNHKLSRGFPYCQGNYLDNSIATVIHLYYQANKDFQRSVLKYCPRPDKSMLNYLSKYKNIEELEKSMDKWDQNSVKNFI